MINSVEHKGNVKLVWKFLTYTFGISWFCWLLLIFLANKLPVLDRPLFILGTFGPAIGAKLVMKLSLKDFIRYILSAKQKTWLFLLVFMLLIFAVYALSSEGWGSHLTFWNVVGSFLYILTFGGGAEEPGWRGFLQPTLEKSLSFPLATTLTGLVWATWHIPLWFMSSSNQYGTSFPAFLAGAVILSFVLGGLYKKTKSVYYCSLFHAFNNAIDLVELLILREERSKLSAVVFILMAIYSGYLWYRTDREEQKQETSI